MPHPHPQRKCLIDVTLEESHTENTWLNSISYIRSILCDFFLLVVKDSTKWSNETIYIMKKFWNKFQWDIYIDHYDNFSYVWIWKKNSLIILVKSMNNQCPQWLFIGSIHQSPKIKYLNMEINICLIKFCRFHSSLENLNYPICAIIVCAKINPLNFF